MTGKEQNLKRAAQKALLENPHTKEHGIEVLTRNNIITIKGVVPSAYIKDTAEVILRDLEDVEGVINELRVKTAEENPFQIR
jgi:osmotically-inducible protein OsmY